MRPEVPGVARREEPAAVLLDAAVILDEVGGQESIRHQMEEVELHERTSSGGLQMAKRGWAKRVDSITWESQIIPDGS